MARCPQHPDAPTVTRINGPFMTWHCSVCNRTLGQALRPPKRGAA